MPRLSAVLFASLSVAALLGAACDDKKPVADTIPSATTTTSASAAPSMTASAAPSASASAMPSASASATASATTSAAPSASAASTMNGAGVCGKKPLPNCPLQGWMKANTSAAMATQDFDALAKALDATVRFAPPGYGNWGSISRDGAAAARAQNLDGVKASCKGCHNQYQTRYRNELRTRKI